MNKAIGYIRVSTQSQVTDGVSLEAQRQKIEAWALVNDAELVEMFEDAGISGKRADNRIALQGALQAACDNKAALVVYSLSRVSRSTKDTLAMAERLEKAGADLVSLSEQIDTTSAAGKMVFRMLAVLAEFERDLVSERTRAALSHMKAQGKKTGGDVPFGFDNDDGNLVINEAEDTAVETILELHSRGKSLRQICTELEWRGIHTKRGKGNWQPTQVSRILKRAA